MASRKVANDLSSVIKSHTETKTLEELAAEGKKQVRVVSGQKVMRIIQAIVDDTIANETSALVRKDRDRIVDETRSQFDRVMKIQGEQEDVIRKQKDLVRKYQEEAEESAHRVERLSSQLTEERDEQASREARLVSGYQERLSQLETEQHDLTSRFEGERGQLAGRQEQAINEAQRRVADIETERANALRKAEDVQERHLVTERSLSRAEAKLAALESTMHGHEREVTRLAERLDDATADAAKRESVLTKRHEEQLTRLRDEQAELVARFEAERGDLAGRQEQALTDSRSRVSDVERERDEARRGADESAGELRDVEQKVGRVEARLATATKLIEHHEGEIERLNQALKDEREQQASREGKLISDYQVQISRVQQDKADLVAKHESERGQLSGRSEQAKEDAGRRLDELAAQHAESKTELDRVGGQLEEEREEHLARQTESRTVIENLRVEVERLTGDLASERERREEQKAGISTEYEERISGLRQEQTDLLARFESERGEEAGRREQALADSRARVEELDNLVGQKQEQIDLLARSEGERGEEAGRREQALTDSRARVEELDNLVGQKQEKEAELAAYHKAQLAEVRAKYSSLETDSAGRDQALTDTHRRIEELSTQRDEAREAKDVAETEVRQSERKLRRMQARQTTARSKLEEREREVARLSDELATADQVVREAQEGLAGMASEIAAAREEAEKSAVSKVRGEVGELKELLSSLAERGSGPDEATLEALIGQLGERDTELEGRLNVQLDRTLEEITRSLHRATASPIEVFGEATDILVGRIFDEEHEMTSNLDSLEVQELATKGGVENSIAQLRAARGAGLEDAS